MNLSKRLKYIYSEVDKSYDEVWDLCCDHGDLGVSLLESNDFKKVHFVDQVKKITDILSRRLIDLGFKTGYDIHTIDAHNLKLGPDSKNLVIISGVGGEVCKSILLSLLSKYDCKKTDFLLCVHYHIFDLREFLIKKDFRLKREGLIFDRGRSYEFLSVSLSHGDLVSPIGSTMWDLNDQDHFKYLSKLIKHYEIKNNFDENDQLTKALFLYKDLLSKFCEVMN